MDDRKWILGYDDSKRKWMSVRIIGNEQEIEWAKEALRNQCNDCPYLDCCNEKAKEESKQCGTVRFGCREYLKEKIEFVVEK